MLRKYCCEGARDFLTRMANGETETEKKRWGVSNTDTQPLNDISLDIINKTLTDIEKQQRQESTNG